MATFDKDQERELMSYLHGDGEVPTADVEEEEYLFLDPLDPMTYPDEQDNDDIAEFYMTKLGKICCVCGNDKNVYLNKR